MLQHVFHHFNAQNQFYNEAICQFLQTPRQRFEKKKKARNRARVIQRLLPNLRHRKINFGSGACVASNTVCW
jgi:hypothetical protein